MDSKTTDSIEASLNELRAKALNVFNMRIIKIYSAVEHPAFIPHSLVSEAVRAAEENVNQFVRQTVSGVSAISEAPEAFLLVRDAVAAHLLDLEIRIEQGRGVPLPPDMLKVINERFEAVSQRAYQNLENRRASFSGSRNKGGRLPEWNWEEAEAHVRGKFSDGIPMGRGAQAKIVNLMAEWFSETYDKEPGKTELNRHAAALVNGRGNVR
ncbi:MAG: hypothetical protein LCH47_06060 [Proteobacteria bacterium]|nr:hypothetical protein [Pseudomonadota bacterium]